MLDFIITNWLQMISAALFAYLMSVIKKDKQEKKALRQGMRAILRDRIIQAYNHYLDKGYCPIYARENITNMYKAYHDLGGNGTITELYNKLMDMPTEPQREVM